MTKEFRSNNGIIFAMFQIFSIFVPTLVRCSSFTGKRLKRESGANPGQSRCCKFHKRRKQIPFATESCIREGVYRRKQVRRPAVCMYHYHCFRGRGKDNYE
ncbi:hypothetical protein EZS27_029130 [termite gut metagenome]|uniref:Uncharacterized protein n=1 Tax=termite gut metagenome TaxID=433724 RepID=A0A5J4QIQ1_9ZZZZ